MKNSSNDYPWQAMLAVTGMGLAGILFIYVTGFFSVTSFDEFLECFSENGLALIFSLFFIGICVFCWISFFRNVILKPKEEILYLSKIEGGNFTFLDKKGKKICDFISKKERTNYEVGKYYCILKTKDEIKKIMEESKEKFEVPKEKKSYWLNFYSPMGNFEDLFLLPIVYVIFLPGFFSILLSKGFDKIFGIIWCLIPGYVIIYDLIYKIKLKKNNYKKIDDSAFLASYIGLKVGITLCVGIIINIIFIYLFLKSEGIGKIIMLIFCLCALCATGQLVSELLGNEKMKKFFIKGYLVLFILFMSKIVNSIAVDSIINKDYSILLFIVPFWIVLIYLIYKVIKK